MRILIADDDRDLASAIAEYVRELNHEVVDKVTGGGVAVIQSFARHLPDVVLLDIMMPRCNGLTVCHAIKSRSPETKIIFMSGKVEGDHPFVANCNANGYIQKPVLLNDLRKALDALYQETEAAPPSEPKAESGSEEEMLA